MHIPIIVSTIINCFSETKEDVLKLNFPQAAFSRLLKKSGGIIAEAVFSFGRNNDLSAASSLAFSTTLALIPALFLLTVLIGAAIGSSARALKETEELLTQLIPAYSHVVMREVSVITSHKRAIGTMNLLVLFLSITPLAADLRTSLCVVFRKSGTSFFR